MQQVTRALFALAAVLVFAGCGETGNAVQPGDDPITRALVIEEETVPDGTYARPEDDPTYTAPTCGDRCFIRIDNNPDGDGPLPPDPSPRQTGVDLGDSEFGQSQEAFSNCWTGPGWSVTRGTVGIDNVPDLLGPCYRANGSAGHDCIFPVWRQRTAATIGFSADTANNNAFCTVGIIGGTPGNTILGDAEIDRAVLSWKNRTLVNLKPQDFNAPVISYMCAPLPLQADDTLAFANPWGPMVRNGRPALFSSTPTHEDAVNLDSNYELQQPTDKWFYAGGAIWLADTTMNGFNESCGGTATQKKNRMRSLAYHVIQHEMGHVLGFTHTLNGTMKPFIACEELSTAPSGQQFEPAVTIGYGEVYDIYSAGMANPSRTDANWFPDNSRCTLHQPVPLGDASDSGEHLN